MLCKETSYISTTVTSTTPTQQTTGFTINYGPSKQQNVTIQSITTTNPPLNDKTTSGLNNEITVSNF